MSFFLFCQCTILFYYKSGKKYINYTFIMKYAYTKIHKNDIKIKIKKIK